VKAKAGAEAQRLRNRQSEPQFDGVVACGDPALQPFRAGERVGSGPVLISSPWDDQVGAAGPSVIVVARWYDPHMPRQKYPTEEAGRRFSQDKCGHSVLR
jgi:hypothetical protein